MNRRKIILTACAFSLVGIGGFVAFGRGSNKGKASAIGESSEIKTAARTVRPRLDPTFRISNQQIAVVEPFYQAPLRARSAGVVRSVRKDIGESVRMGELLVEIDAPDLEQDVLQKEAVIQQRLEELRVSKAMLKHAKSAVETAGVMIIQRTAESRQSEATRDYKSKLLARLKGLLEEKAIRPEIVDENERDFRASEAAMEAGQAAILKAKADEAEKQASLEAATADVALKSALVAVAERDRDKSAAAASFARIVAPFEGVIVKRNVDPGMFVQNATTGSSEPLITVARTDMVTLSMKLPDIAAAYVTRETEVEVSLDGLPGTSIRGKVTRFAPAIDGADRTMRLELDIFNGCRSEYTVFLAASHGEALAPIGSTSALSAAAAFLATERQRRLSHKGVSEGSAICLDTPATMGKRPIVPGMTANMKVYLDKVASAFLLPASAVYTQGGKSFILLVREGVTRQTSVILQVNDGRMAKVVIIEGSGTRELNGSEEVVISRQSELGDGAKVRTVLSDW